jgi:hypothetical protein
MQPKRPFWKAAPTPVAIAVCLLALASAGIMLEHFISSESGRGDSAPKMPVRKPTPELNRNSPNSTQNQPPELSFSLSPARIQQGEKVILSWRASNATEVTIDSIGGVPLIGSRSIYPSHSANFVCVAVGVGGRITRTAAIEVLEKKPLDKAHSKEQTPAPAEGVRVEIFARDLVVFDIQRDDAAKITRSMGTGQNEKFNANRSIILKFGDTDAVQITFNGKELPRIKGLHTIAFGLDGYRVVQ